MDLLDAHKMADAARCRAISIHLADAFVHRRPYTWKDTEVLISGGACWMRHRKAVIATHLRRGIQLGFHGMVEETVLDRLNAIAWMAFGHRQLFRMELSPVRIGRRLRPNYSREGVAIYLWSTEIHPAKAYTMFYLPK